MALTLVVKIRVKITMHAEKLFSFPTLRQIVLNRISIITWKFEHVYSETKITISFLVLGIIMRI